MRSLGDVVALGMVAAACGVGGCGGDDTVDAAKVEQGIEQSLSTPTTKVSSVSCPDDVKNETGKTFTCKAKLSGGGSGDVTVKITDAPNDFSYSFKPGTVVLAGASLDKALEQELATSGAPNATVNCPDKVKVESGTTVTCPVTGGGGGVGSVSFQFTDASGSIEGSSVKTGS